MPDNLFWNLLFSSTGLFTLAGISGGIAVSLFTKAQPENYIVLGFLLGSMTLYLGTFGAIINGLGDENSLLRMVVYLIFVPLGIGYFFSLIDYFRGNG